MEYINRFFLDPRFRYFYLLFLYELSIGLSLIWLDINIISLLLLTWGVPIIFMLFYLANVKKALRLILISVLFSIPASIIIDTLGHTSRAWEYWSNPKVAITGIDVFTVPIEIFVWGFLFFLFYLLIYVLFIDRKESTKIPVRYNYFILALVWISIVVLGFYVNNAPLYFPYYFLLANLFFLVSILAILYLKIVRISSIVFFVVISGILGVMVEIFSLMNNLWEFPFRETSILFLDLGLFSIPIEEIIFWFIVPLAIAVYYELFCDTFGSE